MMERCHRVLLILLMALMVGCECIYVPHVSTVDELSEPTALPDDVSRPRLAKLVLDGVVAEFDYSGCPQNVLVSREPILWFFSSVALANSPFQDPVRSQFERVFTGFFRMRGYEQGRRVVVKVIADQVNVSKTGGDSVKSSAVFTIMIVDQETQKPLLTNNYTVSIEDEKWDGKTVPLSVYRIANQIATNVRLDISEKSSVFVTEPPSGYPGTTDPTTVRSPEFVEFDIKPSSDSKGAIGCCSFACNDWDSLRAADLLNRKLEDRAASFLGIPLDRVRVIHEDESFDAERKEWHMRFRAFARVAKALDYDSDSRCGVCTIDLELANLEAKDAAKMMKEYVMQEMNQRGIIVVKGKDPSGAGVRFDSFKTDEHYNIISCTFRLVK